MWTEQYFDDSIDFDTCLKNAWSFIQSDEDEREERGRREEYLKNGIALYDAVLKEDWKSARKIHSEHPNCFVAALEARNSNLIIFFLSFFIEDELELTSRNKIKARVCLALASGTVTVAREMIGAHPELPLVRNHKGLTPLHIAIVLGYKEMVRYLLPLTLQNPSTYTELVFDLFITSINTNFYDIAFEILNNRPDLALYDNEEAPKALCAIVENPSPKSNGSRLSIWSNFFKRNGSYKENVMLSILGIRLWDEVLRQQRDLDNVPKLMRHPWKVLFTAVEVGNVKFVTTILTSYPDLIWKLNDKRQSLLHVAVQHRQEQIFSNIILMMDEVKDLLATCVNNSNGNNILHMAALLPSRHRLYCRSGKAIIVCKSGDTVIAMHQEMVWFKAIEDLVHPKLGVARNLNEETPCTLFVKEHRRLMEGGKSWMLDIAMSCNTINTLIIFVVLITALRSFVKPLFSQGAYPWYQVFVIFDSMSLISSIASIFVFSSISASNFNEEDFHHSLPRKLMLGITLLIVSIATLVIALIATLPFFSKLGWLYLGTSALACLPIIAFAGDYLPQLIGLIIQLLEVNSSLKTVTSLGRSNLIS